jgi:phosphoglucosamine mutase
VVVQSGKSLAELTSDIQKMPQVMINVPVAADAKSRLDASDPIRAAVADVECSMNGRGRVILRPSGTEPYIRVTLEGEDGDQVSVLANELAEVVRRELG